MSAENINQVENQKDLIGNIDLFYNMTVNFRSKIESILKSLKNLEKILAD